ncbi:MAG: adenylyl-sulfate kinase [Cyclobacteriaceae bacterium]
MAKEIYPENFSVNQEMRTRLLGQRPVLIWFTGLSGSGKSTLANRVEIKLYQKNYKTFLLDGDNVRNGLNKDLSFTVADRVENMRRIAEVCDLMLDAGLVVISSFIAPFIKDREMVMNLVGADNFLEIYLDCPLEVCEKRDVKGLYDKARKGLIPNFTGIDSPYEPPDHPFLAIKSHEMEIETAVAQIIEKLEFKIKL